MLDTDIEQIIRDSLDKSPIWYGSINYRVKFNRKFYPYVAHKIVMKGTEAEILSDESVKKSVLKSYFKYSSNYKNKVHTFDLEKITLDKAIFKKFLGYGIKRD